MKALAAVLVIVLSNQGHWFGGRPGQIEVRWAMKGELPQAVLSWEAEFAGSRLAGDGIALRTDREPTKIDLTLPEVRVRTVVQWKYQVRRRDDGKLLSEGGETIYVYPRQILAGVAERLKGKTILVCDRPDGLPRLLSDAEIPHQRIEDGPNAAAALQTAAADILLIGPDQIGDTPFGQTALLNQAQAGRSVLLFSQTRVRRLMEYALSRRPRPTKLEWRIEHVLLTGLEAADLQSWLRDGPRDVWAVQLPADEPALEVAYWARETPGTEPVPIDALLAVKSVGAGRIVLCQLPLGPWGEDPRSQLLVRNTLDYLATRPEPTLPPSQRAPASKPAEPEIPRIPLSPGGKP
jgi:hypothetical protein